jgi:hypothetical protein
MTQNEVLAMMHDIIANNQKYSTWTVSTPHLVMIVNKAIEEEREACAKLCWSQRKYWDAEACADAIRARGTP